MVDTAEKYRISLVKLLCEPESVIITGESNIYKSIHFGRIEEVVKKQ